MLWQDTQVNFNSERNSELSSPRSRRAFPDSEPVRQRQGQKWLQARQSHPRPFLIALGDSPNDLSLLAAADVAVVIKSGKSDPSSTGPCDGDSHQYRGGRLE